MDTKLTTKSQEALSASGMNASTAGNPQIEPAHLLKALLDQRDSVAVALLKTAGLDVEALSVKSSTAINALPANSGSSVAQAQFSRQLLQVVSTAQEIANNMGDTYVSTEHLLIALASDQTKAGGAARLRGYPGIVGGNVAHYPWGPQG